MKITECAKLVAKNEGGKVSISIAQISEVLKVLNKILGGALYKLIRGSMLLFILCSIATMASAGTVTIDKLPGTRHGIIYSVLDKEVSYLTTTNLTTIGKFCLDGGYSAKNKCIGIISYQLFDLSHLKVPVLNLLEVHPGIYAGIDRIALNKTDGNNEFDCGLSLTLIDIKF